MHLFTTQYYFLSIVCSIITSIITFKYGHVCGFTQIHDQDQRANSHHLQNQYNLAQVNEVIYHVGLHAYLNATAKETKLITLRPKG